MTILYVSHGHPQFSKGGGEIAAWRLFEAFQSEIGYENSGFLAASFREDAFTSGCEVKSMSHNQWIVRGSKNPVLHSSAINCCQDGALYQALQNLPVQLIHAHHYLHIGIDILLSLKKWFPQAKLVLTLHDYWGICVFEGRLLRRSGEICRSASPSDCDRCLGFGHRAELAIRQRRLQRLMASVDHFISPSFFLKTKYLEWGISPQKISVIENLPLECRDTSTRQTPIGFPKGSLTLAYFGQVNQWKGLDIILKSIQILKERGREIKLRIHGIDQNELASDGGSTNNFLFRCSQLIASIGWETVRVMGRYDPSQISLYMLKTDLVLMGSIWYENSPMVIQEAYVHHVPVIAPRLGGMAEKIDHGVSGLLFEPGDERSLADNVQSLMDHPDRFVGMAQAAKARAQKSARAFRCHQQLYRQLIKS